MFVQVLWDTGGVVKLSEPGQVGALGGPPNTAQRKIQENQRCISLANKHGNYVGVVVPGTGTHMMNVERKVEPNVTFGLPYGTLS